MVKRLDRLKHRALVIFTDGSWEFNSNHTLACKAYEDKNGLFPDDDATAGFLTVSELREVELFMTLDINICRKVMESIAFLRDLATI